MQGVITGDSNIANEGLRRFFEQKFHEGSDSYVKITPLLFTTLRLLQRATTARYAQPCAHVLPPPRDSRMQKSIVLAFSNGLIRLLTTYTQTLEEAVTTARTAGDNATLQHCTR